MNNSSKLGLTVNGQAHASDAENLFALLEELGLNASTVVAELNGRIVAVPQFSQTRLADGDVVELINFVGGG